MPNYAYTAKEGPFKVIDGVIEAGNRQMAVGKIIHLGLTPLDLVEKKETQASSKRKTSSRVGLFGSVKANDVVLFTRQLCDLTEASIPILRSLQMASQQFKQSEMKKIVLDVLTHVENGGSLSEALSRHPDVFSALYINMVRIGELSGNLPVILARLAEHLETEAVNKRKIVVSLAYPGLVLVVGMITIFVLLSFVIPRITVMFEDLNQELPLITHILVEVSHFFARWWWAILGMIVLLGYSAGRLLRTNKGRYKMDQFLFRMPLLGEFIRQVEISRFTKTLATLLDSGIVINQAVSTIWRNIENLYIRENIKHMANEVSNGAKFNTALKNSRIFPDMVVNMISVGEETGSLGVSLNKVAAVYERQSELTAKTMIALLGPLVLIFIILIIGVLVVAMLLPIFQMNLLIQ